VQHTKVSSKVLKIDEALQLRAMARSWVLWTEAGYCGQFLKRKQDLPRDLAKVLDHAIPCQRTSSSAIGISHT
jgi:hypothetical protein